LPISICHSAIDHFTNRGATEQWKSNLPMANGKWANGQWQMEMANGQMANEAASVPTGVSRRE
jgi:hypothetical protein